MRLGPATLTVLRRVVGTGSVEPCFWHRDGIPMHDRRSIRSRHGSTLFVISALFLGALGTLGVNSPAAKADPVCDLFTSDHAINIDFKQPPANIRVQALQVTPIVAEVFKRLPADTPASVRSFFGALVRLVAQATTVRTTTKSGRLRPDFTGRRWLTDLQHLRRPSGATHP